MVAKPKVIDFEQRNGHKICILKVTIQEDCPTFHDGRVDYLLKTMTQF